MATNHTPTINTKKPSKLAAFNLGFEYNRSWTEAKQSVQLRPGKK